MQPGIRCPRCRLKSVPTNHEANTMCFFFVWLYVTNEAGVSGFGVKWKIIFRDELDSICANDVIVVALGQTAKFVAGTLLPDGL